jgi:MoaA/NifB/PqqE/SkfB family radical SAM enzyme
MLPATEVRAPERLERLPLVTLYLSERCNSRCVSCDYWRHGVLDMNLLAVRALLPELRRLRTEVVLLSGGEPLLNPEWLEIAQTLRAENLKLWLLTSGLSLAKHARRAAALFETITVSLDGTDRATYAAIRGLDAFDKVCEGIGAASGAGARVTVRVTLQRANYRELPRFIELARRIGVRQVSFVAVDVANPHAFGREDDYSRDLALGAEDLPRFAALLDALEREHSEDFRRGFIAESPAKLRRLLQYFAALLGQGDYPAVRCNAPEFSAVIDARARVRPCFFIPGGESGQLAAQAGLGDALNAPGMRALRANIRAGTRTECATCVCPLWRDPGDAAALLPRPPPALHGA